MCIRDRLEAAACGLPIVATNVGGTAEIFPDGEALLVSPNVPELVASLRPVLSDSSVRLRLGAAARQRIVSFFNVKYRGEQLADHYECVLAMRPRNNAQNT